MTSLAVTDNYSITSSIDEIIKFQLQQANKSLTAKIAQLQQANESLTAKVEQIKLLNDEIIAQFKQINQSLAPEIKISNDMYIDQYIARKILLEANL